MLGIDLTEFIKTVGYIGITGIVFVESGLLIGIVLPGDSLLFTTGLLASQGYLDLTTLLVLAFPAAILGDNLGYYLGRRYGPTMFKQEEGRLFGKQQLVRAQALFEKHGGKTVTFARFIPLFRSFIPMLAGIGRMPYRTFMLYNVIGAFGWAIGLQVAGYYLGKSIPDADKYLMPIIGVVLLVTVGPTLWKVLGNRETRAAIWDELKNYIFR